MTASAPKGRERLVADVCVQRIARELKLCWQYSCLSKGSLFLDSPSSVGSSPTAFIHGVISHNHMPLSLLPHRRDVIIGRTSSAITKCVSRRWRRNLHHACYSLLSGSGHIVKQMPRVLAEFFLNQCVLVRNECLLGETIP